MELNHLFDYLNLEIKMNLEKGCNYCRRLISDRKKWKYSKYPDWEIQNGGACFLRIMNDKFIIIENCPDFLKSKNNLKI
jgi:hypothetical protein